MTHSIAAMMVEMRPRLKCVWTEAQLTGMYNVFYASISSIQARGYPILTVLLNRLNLRLVGEVGAITYVRRLFSQWALSTISTT